MKNSGYMQ